MLINGIDISAYNARQHTFTYNPSGLRSNSDWIAGMPVPYLARSMPGFKDFTVTLVVKGTDREDIHKKISDIVSLLLMPADLKLDDMEHMYRAYLKSTSVTERVLERYHLLALSFSGFEYMLPDPAEGTGTLTIENPGNVISPCIVRITPGIGAASIQLTGLCRNTYTGEDRPVTISTLTSGSVILLDGVNGIVTEEGEPKEVEMWHLPSLLPGENVITCDNINMNLWIQPMAIYV